MTAGVGPILERAARYFLSPVDLIPEMTQGLPGLQGLQEQAFLGLESSVETARVEVGDLDQVGQAGGAIAVIPKGPHGLFHNLVALELGRSCHGEVLEI